jgi:monoamine oxidase
LTGFARPPHDLVPDDVLARDLAEAYATPAGELRDVTICRWADVPRIGGCDVCFEPGQLCELGPLLGAHHSSIRFAGPERSSWPNNMEGALESGAHAAAATLRSLAERLPIRPQT